MNVKMSKLTNDLKKVTQKRDLNTIDFARRYIKEPTLSIFRSQLRVGWGREGGGGHLMINQLQYHCSAQVPNGSGFLES